MLSQPGLASRHWCRFLLVCVALSGCTAAYRFQYEYAMVAPSEQGEGIEDAHVRIRMAPTAEAGVLQLAVLNKSVQPVAVVWAQTHYVDPLGRPRPVLEAGAQGLIRSPGWFVADSKIEPGTEIITTVRPGGTAGPRLARPSRSAVNNVDPRVPAEEEFDTTARLQGHPAYNPFTVSRYAGGDVVVSSAPLPFLPTSGDTPTLGEAYKGREFRFILALRQDNRIITYPFIFRITSVAAKPVETF